MTFDHRLHRRTFVKSLAVGLAASSAPLAVWAGNPRDRRTAAGRYRVVNDFDGTTASGGASPRSDLVAGPDGSVYGMSDTVDAKGRSYKGAIYRIGPNGKMTTLRKLEWRTGVRPGGGLTLARSGSLWGTTTAGGKFGAGVAFRLDADGTYTVVRSFSRQDSVGVRPGGKLVEAADGSFWGTTFNGSLLGSGCIYRMTPDGAASMVHAFDPFAGDDGPRGSDLCLADDGHIYLPGFSAIFRITVSGEVLKVATLVPEIHGSSPNAGLIQGRDGDLYGPIGFEGPKNGGTVVRVNVASGTVTTLHAFELDSPEDGSTPVEVLLQASDGMLYGTNLAGGRSSDGANQPGTVWRVATDGSNYETLLSFSGGAPVIGGNDDGWVPSSALVESSPGTLVGTTDLGGLYQLGTLYTIQSR